jgi:hypothetical protein
MRREALAAKRAHSAVSLGRSRSGPSPHFGVLGSGMTVGGSYGGCLLNASSQLAVSQNGHSSMKAPRLQP